MLKTIASVSAVVCALCTTMSVLLPTVAHAQPAAPQPLQVRRTELPVKVDGSLDEPAWSPFPSGSCTPGDADYEAGLSARWSVTPNVVFSGTLNPDVLSGRS